MRDDDGGGRDDEDDVWSALEEEERQDETPAVWWATLLENSPEPIARAAGEALGRVVDAGGRPVDVLQLLQAVQINGGAPMRRDALLAHASAVEGLLAAWDRVSPDASFYGGLALDGLLTKIRPSVVAHLKAIWAAADARKQSPNVDTSVSILRLAQAIRRRTRRAFYKDISVLLAAVGVARNASAIKQLVARRAQGRGERGPDPKPIRRTVPKQPRGRPRKPNAAAKRHTVVSVRDLENLGGAAPRIGKKRPGDE